ncbi:MAG: MBOAT family protein [Paludibacteraceae bacterium]|nr:MBOAT family protein [Paludibacteraceae bacterium]MBR4840868.1 MBOAT family protein [Paludibacteraceae bacterium]
MIDASTAIFNDIIVFLKSLLSYDSLNPLLFTQFQFWAFFALVFAIFSLVHSRVLLRNAYLFFVSLFFYYKTSDWFTLILLFTTIFNYFDAFGIEKSKSEGSKKFFLIIGLIVNLLTLCYFKYAYLFVDMVKSIFGIELTVFNAFAWLGNEIAGKALFDVDKILLPVGISFFTFQSISYLMDIYRKRITPVKNLLDFGFYISFFPQLVAGPIVRAKDFIPQLHKKFFLTQRQFGIAIFWILNGMAKKIILSDYIAVNFVDRVFENPTMYSGFENLAALFEYSLQVYADFSGYTDIAIGVAMLMGFYLPKNFNSPYKAKNAGNFWKRWHISLSKWLQDYLYIPMGGNRNATFATYFWIITIALIAVILSGSLWVAVAFVTIALILAIAVAYNPEKLKKIHTNMNSMNTMLLGGLWHGASCNFVIWGGLNGVGMIIFKFWRDMNVYVRTLTIFIVTVIFAILDFFFPLPIFNIAVIWTGIIFIGTFLRMTYNLCGFTSELKWLENAWAVLQTFTFITWTRLFFRAGSNLDPAEANETAWNTAKDMVTQIGSSWNLEVIPDMIHAYRYVFSLFVIGMIIHWLPENFKRRYRLSFAMLPLPVIAVIVVVSVFIIYQFITADLQKFIYFQF